MVREGLSEEAIFGQREPARGRSATGRRNSRGNDPGAGSPRAFGARVDCV